MNDKNHLDKKELGENIVIAFKYIQQIFRETAQLMRKLDSLMGKEWVPTYGNRTTKKLSQNGLGKLDGVYH